MFGCCVGLLGLVGLLVEFYRLGSIFGCLLSWAVLVLFWCICLNFVLCVLFVVLA